MYSKIFVYFNFVIMYNSNIQIYMYSLKLFLFSLQKNFCNSVIYRGNWTILYESYLIIWKLNLLCEVFFVEHFCDSFLWIIIVNNFCECFWESHFVANFCVWFSETFLWVFVSLFLLNFFHLWDIFVSLNLWIIFLSFI